MARSQKKSIHCRGTLLSFFIVFFFLLLLSTAHAEIKPYTPLVSIPGLTNQKMASLPDYLNKVYFLIITIGALYGVVKIAFAGVKYSMSDIITSKESAKADIKGVLLGLAILLIPFIVLKTINPELTRLDVLYNAPKVQLKGTSPQSTPTYQVDDLNAVGTQIRTVSGTNNTSSQSGPVTSNNTSNTDGTTNREILIPIKSGTAQELENIRSLCTVEMPGYTANFWKDPAQGKYVCRNY